MNQTNYKGLWIPENILIDKKLADKEKLILAMILFLSTKDKSCTTSNQTFADKFNLSTNRISKIISALKNKNYIEVNFLYKDNGKEIIKRILSPIVKNDNKYCQKEQQPIGENDKVIKNNNKNIINNYTDAKSLEERKYF